MTEYSFVIPCYQHSSTLEAILRELKRFDCKTFVVNDGSDANNSKSIEQICQQFPFVEVLHHPQNLGKGAAVATGLRAALSQGYSYGVQIDSDGQHDLNKVAPLIELSKKYPQQLISGRPIYDESVPKTRLIGRYATHIWVWIETLSLQLKDSMCGFRVYPLSSSVDILNRYRIGQRMDFDTEIMVHLYWSGTSSQFLPVPVTYPVGGISHFDVLHDNVRITKMHTRLFFGMLWRLPKLLFCRPKRSGDQPWHKIEEFGNFLGFQILILFYRLLGRSVLNFVLLFVAFYYSLVSSNAKQASRSFVKILNDYTKGQTKPFTPFQHIYSFASMAIDKFAVWIGDITVKDLEQDDVQQLLDVLNTQQGAFFLTSHFGNIEVCRALGRFFPHVRFNALVYHENAQKFNNFLSRINPESKMNLISLKDVGPDMAMQLKEKVDHKEWIFMMGDRGSVQDNQRTMGVQILGREAQISEGPFILGYILDVPIYVIHCFKSGKKFRLQMKRIDQGIERSRATRQASLRLLADRYAGEVTSVILQEPRQWFNFFDFWRSKT